MKKRYDFPDGIIHGLLLYWRVAVLAFPMLFLVGAVSPCSAASLFLPSSTNDVLYRYDVEPAGASVLTASIVTSDPTGIAFGPTGELFVANFVTSTVSRFLDALGSPVANGIISGLNHPEE